MGFFGNKKKRYVSSTVYNLAGDEDKRPNFLKATVIGAVIGGKDSLAQAIQDAYATGPGTRLKRFNNNYDNKFIEIKSKHNFSFLKSYSYYLFIAKWLLKILSNPFCLYSTVNQ